MKWCEIFRAGTYKDAKGKDLVYSDEDIETIAKNFNEGENSTAPIVVGHPKSNSPAYGWVDSLKAESGKLYASFKQVADEFAEWVNEGRYKNRSVSLYPDRKLRHVGFFGATPPKVKGMPEYVFSEDSESETYDFGDLDDYKFDTVARILQRLRDFLIEKYDVETADNLITAYNIENLKEVEKKTAEEVNNYCEKLIKKREEQELEKQDNSNKGKQENFSEELSKTKALAGKLLKENEELKASTRKAECEDFAEKAISSGNITPAQKATVIEFMEICHEVGTFDFAEGEDKSVVNRFKEFIGKMKQIDFSELPDGEVISTFDFADTQTAAAKIQNYQAEQANKGITVSVLDAVKYLKGTKQ